jgi:hypothetical protein
MRSVIVMLIALVAAFSWTTSGPARAEDGIVIQSMRVEGTIPKADDPIFDINPYRKDRALTAWVNGQFGGDEFCVVAKDKPRVVVWMNFGGDKKLKEQAAKLVGQRVVVQCKGEYKPYTMKVNVQQRQGSAEEEQAGVRLVLTVVKIELAR